MDILNIVKIGIVLKIIFNGKSLLDKWRKAWYNVVTIKRTAKAETNGESRLEKI